MYEPKPNDHTRLVQGTIEEVLEGKEKFIIFSHDHPQGAGEFTMNKTRSPVVKQKNFKMTRKTGFLYTVRTT